MNRPCPRLGRDQSSFHEFLLQRLDILSSADAPYRVSSIQPMRILNRPDQPDLLSIELDHDFKDAGERNPLEVELSSWRRKLLKVQEQKQHPYVFHQSLLIAVQTHLQTL